jgi:predicted HicB family RNase H-like nuclease
MSETKAPKGNRRRTTASKKKSEQAPVTEEMTPVESRATELPLKEVAVSSPEDDDIAPPAAKPAPSRLAPRNETPRENAPARENTPAPTQQPNVAPRGRDEQPSGKPRSKPTDEYCFAVHFDRNQRQFIGTVLEYPEVKATGATRDAVVQELDRKLDQLIQNSRRKHEPVVDPVSTKRYPDRLDLGISQTLFRKLDVMSRHEKVSLDQLVVELLTAAVEHRRKEPAREKDHGGGRRHQNHNEPRSGNNRHQGQQQQHRGNRRNFQDTMENRENFMEYVRNLEKGGGPGWRKK